MAIKSTIRTELPAYDPVLIHYPQLLVSGDGYIVLFWQYQFGMVVGHQDGSKATWGVGHFSEDWVMGMFKPYRGKVTLEGVFNDAS